MQSKYFYHSLVFIFTLFTFATFAHAASLFGSDFTLVVSPSSPKPGDAFTARAQSFQFDTAQANFQWFLGGKQISSGVGLVEQNFTLGSAGSELVIRVNATTANGEFFETQKRVVGNEIDFVVSPRTSVPATYRGSALATPGSIVKVNALPHLFLNGVRRSHKNLLYEWSLDGKKIEAQSGQGRNEFLVQLSPVSGGEHVIRLLVSSLDGVISAEKSVRIKTASPEVVLYQTSALTGKRPVALLGLAARSGQSLSIVAEPYFFDLALLPRIIGLWVVDGVQAPTEQGQNSRLLQLAIPENTPTYASILFSLKDKTNVFQRAQNTVTIVTQ